MDQSELIYLDHAAATPVADFVLAAMQPYLTDRFYNPSSPYAPAIAVRRDYQAAKARLAAVIGARADEITITAGATESVNLMIQSVNGHIVAAATEHAAVLKSLAKRSHTLVAPTASGTILPAAIQAAITPDTQLVTVALANNEIGTIQPLKDIAAIVDAEKLRRKEAGEANPIYFHSDASQGAGYIDLHVNRLGVDALTLNAGKLHGPKQVGLLWATPQVKLLPVIMGGGQERGLRSGTENVAGAVGFAVALGAADAGRSAESERLRGLRDALQTRLEQNFPDAIISGNLKKRLPNFLHISFPGLDAERLLFALDSEGVLVATGSACAANKGTRSHVLTAIGLAPRVADGSIRITLGKLNTAESVNRAGEIMISVIKAEQRRVGL